MIQGRFRERERESATTIQEGATSVCMGGRETHRNSRDQLEGSATQISRDQLEGSATQVMKARPNGSQDLTVKRWDKLMSYREFRQKFTYFWNPVIIMYREPAAS